MFSNSRLRAYVTTVPALNREFANNLMCHPIFQAGIFRLGVRVEPGVPGDRPPAAAAPEGGSAGLSRPLRVADGPQRGEEGGQGVVGAAQEDGQQVHQVGRTSWKQ